MKHLYSIFLLIGSCVAVCSAQPRLDEIKKQFPGEEAVILNKSLHYDISIRDGQPYVESEESQQIQYLSAQAAAYMSRYGFFHSDFQQLVAYEAYTHTAEDKKLKVNEFKTSASKAGFVFYDDVKETTFDFPAVGPGAVGNLKVSRINKNPHLLSPYYFASYLPVLNSELRITFPKDLSLKYCLMGLDTARVEITTESRHHENVYTFRYKNCPSEKRYGDAPDNAWYATHLIFYIDSYKDEKGNTISYLSNLDDLYRLSYGFVKSINTEIKPELKHIVDSLTARLSDPESKARAIYSWVQKQIKYVAFEEGMEGFIPRDANLVCSRRFGDCKDMSSILTTMMKAAGVEAYYTWIGTRNLPYEFSRLPLPLVSNHMICTIRLNGKYIFLDGTDPTCVFGTPSYGIQDKEAMISVNEKEYKILKVPVPDKTSNMLIDSTWMELGENGITGKIKRYFSGYYAMSEHGDLMYANRNNQQQDMKDEFSRGSNKFHLDTFRIGDTGDPNRMMLEGSFHLPDYAKKIGNEWYLNLNLFKFYVHEEIDYPKRKMPIAYNFKSVKKYVIILNIPEGYKVSYMPQGKSFHNAVWGFDLSYEQKGNQLILTQEFDNDHLLLQADQFEAWNKVLENLFPLYKETVSIAKN